MTLTRYNHIDSISFFKIAETYVTRLQMKRKFNNDTLQLMKRWKARHIVNTYSNVQENPQSARYWKSVDRVEWGLK